MINRLFLIHADYDNFKWVRLNETLKYLKTPQLINSTASVSQVSNED